MKKNIFFVALTMILFSCKQERQINMVSDNLDSIVVFKRDEGQLHEFAKRFVIKDRSAMDTIYQSYFNAGKHQKDYYIKLPAGRYSLYGYRDGGRNDTVIIWHDMIRVSGIGVVQLQKNIETYMDELFRKDSSGK